MLICLSRNVTLGMIHKYTMWGQPQQQNNENNNNNDNNNNNMYTQLKQERANNTEERM